MQKHNFARLLSTFLPYLTHSLSRNSRQAAGEGAGERRRKSLLAFPQQHLVVCHIFAYANPESHCEPVSLSLSPRGARCSRAALGASFSSSHNRLENLIYFDASRKHCSQFSIFQFYFQFYFSAFIFPFSFIFFLFACRGAVTNFCHLLLLLPCFVLVCKKGLTHVALPAELCEKLTGFGTDCTRDR